MSTIWGYIWSWQTLWVILLTVYIVICIGLIAIILLQKGKGVGFAGAFGIGPGSETVFGPRGSRSLPVRLTHIGATIFLLLALVLTLMSGKVNTGEAPQEVAGSLTDKSGKTGLEDLGLGTATTGTQPLEAPTAGGSAPAPLTAPAPAPAPAAANKAPTNPASVPAEANPASAPAAKPAPTAPSAAPAPAPTPARAGANQAATPLAPPAATPVPAPAAPGTK